MPLDSRVHRFWIGRKRDSQYSSIPASGLSTNDRSSIDRGSDDALLEKVGLEWNATPRYQSLPFWKSTAFWAYHIIILAVYVSVFLVVSHPGRRCINDQGLPFSPAIEALEYYNAELTITDGLNGLSVFSGEPRPELDQAWHDLLDVAPIVVGADVIEHYGRENTTVADPGGRGYLAILNVHHELHCLKKFHQNMYAEYYFGDMSESQREENRVHSEHCLDFLRQTVMCHGDVGIMNLEWHDDKLTPQATETSHQCANWEKIDRWTRDRTVDISGLIHPTKGAVYPDGLAVNLSAIHLG